MPARGINAHPLCNNGHLEDIVVYGIAVGVALEHLFWVSAYINNYKSNAPRALHHATNLPFLEFSF